MTFDTAKLIVMTSYGLNGICLCGLLFSRAAKWWVHGRKKHRTETTDVLTISVSGDKAIAMFRDLFAKVEPELATSDHVNKEEQGAARLRFVIDAVTLWESYQFVCSTRDVVVVGDRAKGFREAFHYCSGARVDEQTYVIGYICRVSFSQQSAVGVRVADSSNIRTLAALDEIGLPLTAHAHSHPGYGREANRPSITDQEFQERLERAGHCAIGMIFSRDAFVRFFAADDSRFEIVVLGKKVTKVSDYEYKLDLANSKLQLQTPAAIRD